MTEPKINVKTILEMIDNAKKHENDELDNFPIEVAIKIRSGYLLGYANALTYIADELIKELKNKQKEV